MRVLVLGSGGREHALCWKISQSPKLSQLFCAPGNPGTAHIATNIQVDLSNFESIKGVVIKYEIEMVVVGPEDPLVNGLKDFFAYDNQLNKILFVGPDKNGAQLEGSKDFAKNFMFKYGIPTAKFQTFTKENSDQAYDFLNTLSAPYVLKADGLAGGKGVLILDTIEEAYSQLKEILEGKFGSAGNRVVIEEYLAGIEMSLFVLTDGTDYILLPEAKDYKRVGESDTGLNTGGMGSVSPVPFADAEFMKRVEERVVKPTIMGIENEKMDYSGFVFVGLMNCDGSPYVIEYNVRMGDPETQSVMPRIKSDFLKHLINASKKQLSGDSIDVYNHTQLTLVTVSGGYPQEFKKGYPIMGLEKLGASDYFVAGAKSNENNIVTNGGRVLNITASGNSINEARERLYDLVSRVNYQDIYYRKDIGLDLIQ